MTIFAKFVKTGGYSTKILNPGLPWLAMMALRQSQSAFTNFEIIISVILVSNIFFCDLKLNNSTKLCNNGSASVQSHKKTEQSIFNKYF